MAEEIGTGTLKPNYPAAEREREQRWNAPSRARVEHPKYGSVIVPHFSNFAAVLNAAEYWGCDWAEIINAKVWWAGPEDGPAVAMPQNKNKENENG